MRDEGDVGSRINNNLGKVFIEEVDILGVVLGASLILQVAWVQKNYWRLSDGP